MRADARLAKCLAILRGCVGRAPGSAGSRALLRLLLTAATLLTPELARAQEPSGEPVPLIQTERPRRSGRTSVRVPIEIQREAPAASSAVSPQPQDLTVVAGSAHVDRAPDGSVVLEQAKSSTSVVSAVGTKASSPRSLVKADQKVKLPWLVVDSQARNTHEVVRSARPFLKLARAVQWDAARQLHVAEFLIGLDAESGDGGALAEPLVASLAVSCDEVEPHSVRFSTIGSAGDQLVRVACSAKVKNERAEQVLSLRLQGAEYDYPFEVPHRPGRYELQASTSSVLGMGLGELTLTALQREEDGTPLVTKDALSVPLHIDDGELVPDSLTIPAGSAQGSVTVHVRGRGRLQLRAGMAERESQPIPLQVRWPFLLAAMAPSGGALGGFMAVRWQRKQPTRKPVRKYQHVMAIVEGAVVGSVLVLTLMLVPSFGLVPSWARTAEVAWFVSAVFAGFLGLELLDRIARLFFHQREQREPPSPSARASGPK